MQTILDPVAVTPLAPAMPPMGSPPPLPDTIPAVPVSRLSILNRSSQIVRVASRSWTDAHGETVDRRLDWIIQPGETVRLTVDGADLFAHALEYTCVTLHGSVDHRDDQFASDDATITLTDDRLPQPPEPRVVERTVAVPPAMTGTALPTSSPPSDFERMLQAVEKAADTYDTVQRALPSSPPRRAADLIIRSVSVSSTQNGSAWDESGPPDLKVYVEQTRLFGSSFTTDTARDTTYATFNAKAIRVTEGDTIRIRVYDADVLDDDEIGSYEKLITADTLNERAVDWSFGDVMSLRLEFQP